MSGFFHFMADKIREQVRLALHLFQANTNQFPLIEQGVGTISRLMRAISLAERGRLADQTIPASPFAGLVANLGSDFDAKLCGRSATAITLIAKRSVSMR